MHQGWNPAHDLADTITTKPTKNIFFAVFEVFAVHIFNVVTNSVKSDAAFAVNKFPISNIG